MGDDIKLENYKKNVARILDIWGGDIKKIGDQLRPLREELKQLKANKDADKAKLDELTKKCAELKNELDEANFDLNTNFINISVPPKADEDEFAKVPGWIKEIIKKKGIPLGPNVTIAPTVDIDFKKKKVKSLGIKITF